MRIPTRLPTKYIIPLFIVAIVGTAAATMTLFTHTFPVVKTVAPPPVLTSNCATLANETSAPVQGSSGNITFDCGGHTSVMFVNAVGTVTPTFTLPTGYTRLFLFAATISGIPQPACSVAITLTPGNPITFTSGALANTFSYCAEFTSAPVTSFGTFTVTWSQ